MEKDSKNSYPIKMRTDINLDFSNVHEYRRAASIELIARLKINFSNEVLSVLEIGPGLHSELLNQTINSNPITEYFYIDPDSASAAMIQSVLPRASRLGLKVEDCLPELRPEKFDLIYSHFSLHWSDQISNVLSSLRQSLKPSGRLGFTITDQTRSFWSVINRSFQEQFPGSDLFNTSSTKQLNPEDWIGQLQKVGFRVMETIKFSGTASRAESARQALDGLKSAVGPNYLKLIGVTSNTAEEWILDELKRFANSKGEIEIPASGLSFICKK